MKRTIKKFSGVKIRETLGRIARLSPIIQPPVIEKIDESLTPNMRALRLAMSIAEQLLSMGVNTSDVVHMSLGITQTYCRAKVQLDVSSTMITVSQDRGINREPLTLIRTITINDANYQVIQELQSLALEIRDKHLPLEEAEIRADDIIAFPRQRSHSRWTIYLSGGFISTGVTVLYGGSPIMIGLSFVMGFLVTGFLRLTWKLGMSTFYSQITAALMITLIAAIATIASAMVNLEINTTLLVIGGIVLLVAGLMIVGAFQDAIDEYYITANARLLKVVMATGGIVAGVTAGLYVATKLGITFPTTPDQLNFASAQTQYLGALIVAAAFAVRNHARFFGMVISGCVGMLGWWVVQAMSNANFGIVIASGTAAAVIGFMATCMSRLWHFPSMAIIAAGIVPLVPGLSLYNGLMGLVQHSPSSLAFTAATAVLFKAVLIALAVATGASLGNVIGRPLRRRAIQLYNRLPRRQLSQDKTLS